MSWGTIFNADIFLSRQSYDSIASIQDMIKELDEDIEWKEKRLALLAASTPKDVVDEGCDALGWVASEVHQITEEYNDSLIERFKLSLYLDYLDGDENKLIKAE